MNRYAIAYAKREEADQYQAGLLNKLLAYVSERSPFYKEHFERNGIDVTSTESVDDLRKIPPVGKAELQKHGEEFWCVSKREILDYTCTSGTEGKPVSVPLTKNDLDRLAFNEMQSFVCAGGSSDDIFQLTTTSDRRFMAGLAYNLGARKMGAGMVRVGPGLPQMQWDTIAELGTTILIAVPSFLLKMIEYAEKNGIDPRATSVKKAICIGEPIRNGDFSENQLAGAIKRKWPIELYSTYASTEMATAFTECAEGKGGHLLPDLIIAEVLDEQGEAVTDGEPGELTVTTLGVEGMPLVRFKTGDICAMHREPCPCGRSSPRLGPILGRKNQMLKYKGTTIYPQAIFDLLEGCREIEVYQVEVSADSYGNDRILIRYSPHNQVDIEELGEVFKSKTRFIPEFESSAHDELSRSVNPKTGRKPRKFVDLRE